MARSVPGGRSCPAWTGTVVTHLPQAPARANRPAGLPHTRGHEAGEV